MMHENHILIRPRWEENDAQAWQNVFFNFGLWIQWKVLYQKNDWILSMKHHLQVSKLHWEGGLKALCQRKL